MDFGKDLKAYKEFMILRGMSINTQNSYEYALKSFLFNFNIRPTDITDQMIIQYLINIKGRSDRCTIHSAIKLFYRNVLKCKFKLRYIPYPRKEDKLPIHVNQEEFLKLISVCKNQKHKALLCLMFDCGLRVSEIVNLKLEDIDSNNMVINVKQAKGRKDRKVKLTKVLLSILRAYYIYYKPKIYLFNGQKKIQYTKRSCQSLIKNLCFKAGIKKQFSPHKFRHGYAMSLLENGATLDEISNQLGHNSKKTTEIYARMNNKVIQKIQTPLEQIVKMIPISQITA